MNTKIITHLKTRKTMLFIGLLAFCLSGNVTSVNAQTAVEMQPKIDDMKLGYYFTGNGIHATKTSAGLYYVISKNGAGANAKYRQNDGW